jgi:outer membrane receptor for ferrienterochelin and colicins
MNQRLSVQHAIYTALALSGLTAHAAEAPVRADTVNVQESSATSQQLNSFSQKVVVDQKQIESMGVTSVSEVLGKLPGVESFGGGHRTRGMSRDSVQMLVDGERQSGGTMGVLSRLPASEIERVEIYRGNSAEFGGSSPMTINVVLKRALSQQPSEYKLGFGVRKDEPNAMASYTWNGGDRDFSWSLPVTLYANRAPVNTWQSKNTPDFTSIENTDGISRTEHYGISPRLAWKFGRDSINLMPMIFYGPSSKDTEADIQSTNPSAPSYRILHEDVFSRIYRLRMNGEKFFGESKLSARFSFNNRVNDTSTTRYSDESDTQVYSSFNSNSRENESNAALRYDQPIGLHLVSYGIEANNLRRQDVQNIAQVDFSLAPSSAQSIENIVWVQDAWSVTDDLSVTPGLRLEHIRLSSNSNRQQDSAALPSVAIRWQANEHYVWRSSLGAGMKTPKLNEISNAAVPSVGSNAPLDADVRGNPFLKPERNVNFELALERYSSDKASVLSANSYVRATQNFTERVIDLEGSRWVDRPQNVGNSLHWGIELDAKLKTDDWAWSGGTLKSHLVIPRNRVEDDRLGVSRRAKDTPVYTWSFGLDQALPKWKTTMGLDLQISGRSETALPGEQYGLTKAKALLDGYLLYQIDPKLNLRLVGRNLLAADTRSRNRYLYNGDDWQYRLTDTQYPSVMLYLEGRL